MSTSQVSVTRTERENNVHCPHGESDASHSYNPLQDEAHLHSVPSCSVPSAFRDVLPSPRSSSAQSSAGRRKPRPLSWPSSSPTVLPGFSLYSQKPSTASPGSSHSCPHTAAACSPGYCPDPHAGNCMAHDLCSRLTSSSPCLVLLLYPLSFIHLFICAFILPALIEHLVCVIVA